jgi:membrane protease YdiL (CAAX protease family)
MADRHQLIAAVAWGGLAALPLFAALIAGDCHPVGSLRRLQQTVRQHVVPLFDGVTVPGLLAISIAAGLGEEMLFRGVLQAAVSNWIGPPWGVWGGLLIASLLFGACHWISNSYAVLAAVVGLYLGGLFLLSGNLLAPIVAHALYDFLALLYLVRWKTAARTKNGGSVDVTRATVKKPD